MIKVFGYDLAWCWSVFKTMLWVDLAQARSTFAGKIIDRFIWMLSLLLVAAYLLPTMGMTATFGKLMLAGLLVSIGIIESYGVIALIVSDLENDRVISYYLTLPIPPTLVFIRMLVYNALFFAALGFLLFPICNMLLPESIAYSTIHWPKFITIMLLANFFHGSVVLWAATLVQDMRMLGKVWSRILHPLWFLGGFQFTWAAASKKSVWLGYLVLLNPITHATEGIRDAMLGDGTYVPFWITSSVLTIITICITIHAIKRFKRRLDLV